MKVRFTRWVVMGKTGGKRGVGVCPVRGKNVFTRELIIKISANSVAYAGGQTKSVCECLKRMQPSSTLG